MTYLVAAKKGSAKDRHINIVDNVSGTNSLETDMC